MRLTNSLYLIVLFCSITLFASAQQPLSLSDAVQYGLKNNYGIRIAELNVEIAERNNNLGTAGFYPNLSLLVNQSNIYTDPDNPASFLNFPYRNISVDLAVEMNWILFKGFRVYIAKSQLDLLERQTAGNKTIIIENTIQAILLSYYRAVLEQERISVQRELLGLSRDRYEYAVLKKQFGSGGTFEELQFKTAYLSDSSNLLLQEQLYRDAITELKLLLAMGDSVEFTLTDTIDMNAKELTLDDLRSAMLQNNSTLRNQYINYEIFQKEIALQKTELYPTVGANLGAKQGWNNFKDLDGELPDRSTNGSTRSYYANFSLTFNLFNGGNIIRQIKNAEVQAEIASLNIDDMRNKLLNQLKLNFDRYQSQKVLLEVSKLNVETAALNLSLAEDRLKNGSITSLDYRNIQLQYLSASVRMLESVFNLKLTETELLRLTGGIIEER